MRLERCAAAAAAAALSQLLMEKKGGGCAGCGRGTSVNTMCVFCRQFGMWVRKIRGE